MSGEPAAGTLFAIPKDNVTEPMMPALSAPADVLYTGRHGAVCAEVGKGSTVAVVGDGVAP